MKRIDQLLGIAKPIIQAPMAGAQGSELAIAVSNAGGLGSVPAATLSAEQLAEAIQIVRSGTDKPFNVNFFCHELPAADSVAESRWRRRLAGYYLELKVPEDAPAGPARRPFDADTAAVLEAAPAPVVSFHFGLPEEALLDRVRATGAIMLSSATSVAEARWLAERGVDAIIAQGVEAGGHRGHFLNPQEELSTQLGTLALLPQIVSAVDLPVIAAGGIADADGVAASFALGAAGVQVGTTFLLCPEATTSDVHRAALKSAQARVTALTNVFTGRPARGIVNRLMSEVGPLSEDAPAFPLAAGALAGLREAAEAQGSGDFSPLWAGQNVSGCAELPAALLVERLAEGAPAFQ